MLLDINGVVNPEILAILFKINVCPESTVIPVLLLPFIPLLSDEPFIVRVESVPPIVPSGADIVSPAAGRLYSLSVSSSETASFSVA